MNSMLKKALLPTVVCVCCITGCTTLPPKVLYTEPVVAGVAVDTENNHFDVVYAIDYCVMPKAKDDFISFKVDTMLYTYRLDFSVNRGIKNILDRFFIISRMADVQNRKNGIRYLGETALYAYASFEETTSRLVVNNKIANHVRFSFLLKDGEKYLLLERFQAQTLDGKLVVDDFVDSIPFRSDDIKEVYDFFADTKELDAIREKQLHIARTEVQTKEENQTVVKIEEPPVDNGEVYSEKSSADNP